jgi:hypothetical protein
MDGSLSYVVKLVSLHLRPIALTKEEISDAAVRRLIYDAADDLDDLLILCKADITSKNEVKVARYIQKLEVLKEKILEIEAKDKIRNMKLVITGELIMKTFNLKPSKVVGEIKNRVKDAVLDGLIPNEMPQAFDFMQQIAADYLEKNYEVS